ncbi:MAG: F0F1 ATP synthase subunit B [Lachnospiraceae bacterium]
MLRIDINLLFTVINLLVLFVALRIFLFKPVQKIIDARQQEADKQFADAENRKKEADAVKAQYEKYVEDVEAEKGRIISDAKKSADEEYRRIVDEARMEAEEVKKDAVKDAQNEKDRIIRDVENEIAGMVVDAASRMVASKNGAETDSALLDKFLGKAGDEA